MSTREWAERDGNLLDEVQRLTAEKDAAIACAEEACARLAAITQSLTAATMNAGILATMLKRLEYLEQLLAGRPDAEDGVSMDRNTEAAKCTD